MVSPTISVIIPAYNSAAYLECAVKSAMEQTRPPHEILVVDDGSRDNTFQIAQAMPAPVRVIRKENGGPASARNLAARQATGDWLAFLDADDAWLPAKLERQMQVAQTRADLVHCLWRTTNETPDLITFADLWRRNYIATSSVLLRRDVFWQAGAFDEDREIVGLEDYNLWLKLAHRGCQIRTLQEPLLSYTPAAGSLSRQIQRFTTAELANIRKLAGEFKLDTGIVEAKRAAILDEYGRESLYIRDLDLARDYLRKSWQEEFTGTRMAWWALSMIPAGAWKLLDRMRHRVAASGAAL